MIEIRFVVIYSGMIEIRFVNKIAHQIMKRGKGLISCFIGALSCQNLLFNSTASLANYSQLGMFCSSDFVKNSGLATRDYSDFIDL